MKREQAASTADSAAKALSKLRRVLRDAGSEGVKPASRRAFDDLHQYVKQLDGLLTLEGPADA